MALAWNRFLRLRNGNSRLYLTSHHDESLLDIFAVLSGGLKETNVIVLSELLSFIGGDLTSVGHIALVADKDAGDVVRCMLLDLIHPVLNGTEALAVGDVVGHNDTVCALVVAARYGLEALLASSVPNLKLDSLSVNLNGSNFLFKREKIRSKFKYLRSRHQ